MLIGCHVPSFSDYEKMFTYAREVGCECLQMFTKSPRIWQAKPLSDDRISEFKASRRAHDDIPVLIHGAYLLNLIADKPELLEKARNGLANEFVRAQKLGVKDVNVHPGSSKDLNQTDAALRCAESIEIARRLAKETLAAPLCVRIVIENTAGAGSTYGASVEDLAAILHASNLDTDSLGFTIDTAHAWAAGYDLSHAEGWEKFLTVFDERIGLERLQWIHANDSMNELGSRKDRHAWIGEGKIGIEGFQAMCSEPRLNKVGVTCEMPGEMPEKDEVNISLLKAMRDSRE